MSLRRVLMLGALALVAGCGMSASKLSSVGSQSCRTDADCRSGEVCLDVGCAVPDRNLVVQVVPPSNETSLAIQDFDRVDASNNLAFTLGPPAQLKVAGSIYPFQLSVTGTPLHLPDLPYSVAPTTVTGAAQIAVPSGTYQLRATPADPAIPPILAEAVLGGPGASLDLPLTFLTLAEVRVVSGSLYGPGLLVHSPDLAYTVQLLHADGSPASQPASTGDGGSLDFTLYAAPADPGETLHLSASARAGIGPSVTFDGSLETLAALAATDGGLSLGDALPAKVSGHVADASGSPVAGAVVRLVATLPGQARFTSAPATTDATGRYTATCLHDAQHADGGSVGESYQVLVVPPSGAALAMVEAAAQVSAWAPGDAVTDFGTTTLAAPTDVTGVVTDPSGSPVPGAAVQATPAGENDLPLASASTTTAADGTYHLPLTPGTYHFDFTPPLALQAPSNGRGPLAISGSSAQLDLQFSAPHVVSGRVSDPDGHPVEGALVRIFLPAVPHTGSAEAIQPRSTLLARSQVLPDGSFTAVLPAPASRSH